MRQIISRLRPAQPGLANRRTPLPTHLLFTPGHSFDEWPEVEPVAPAQVTMSLARPRRRRTSVLLFLERALCLS